MRIGDYSIAIGDGIREEVEGRRILIQLPDGLKILYQEFYSLFRSLGAKSVFISGDPCYGACDFYEGGGFDNVIQIGHTPLGEETTLEVRWVGELTKEDFERIGARLSDEGIERVGLLATLQFLDLLGRAKEELAKMGFEVFIGKGKRCLYPGQLLGCDSSAAKGISSRVNGFLFIGDGAFHVSPISRKVVTFDPYTRAIGLADGEGHFRRRFGAIEWASSQRDWLVVCSLKSGQLDLIGCELMERMLEERGKEVTKVAMREITPENLRSFKGKACTVVGCPRICEDIEGALNPQETLVALGMVDFEDYMADPFMDWKDEKKRVRTQASSRPS
jgi:2-(3-amino-3-carboxypropyl)histidine synthase